MSDTIVLRILGPIVIVALTTLYYVTARKASREERLRHAEALAAGTPLPPLERHWPWSRAVFTAAGLAAFYLLLFRLVSLAPPFVWDHEGGPSS